MSPPRCVPAVCNKLRLRRTFPSAQAVQRGTPVYMSPELFASDGVHSYASDLWALGCVLYELRVGRPPFVSSSLQELVQLIIHEPFPLPEPGTPNAFSIEFHSLLTGLLEKDPLRRLQWAEVLSHPFWAAAKTPDVLQLPPQPQMELYARRHAPMYAIAQASVRVNSVLTLSTLQSTTALVSCHKL